MPSTSRQIFISRLLRLAAAKEGPTAVAASLLENFYLNASQQLRQASYKAQVPAGISLQDLGEEPLESFADCLTGGEVHGQKHRKRNGTGNKAREGISGAGLDLRKGCRQPRHASYTSRNIKLQHKKQHPGETRPWSATIHSVSNKAQSMDAMNGILTQPPPEAGEKQENGPGAENVIDQALSAKPINRRSWYRMIRKSADSNHQKMSIRPREGPLKEALKQFKDNPGMRDRALAIYVSSKAFEQIVTSFEKFVFSARAITDQLNEHLSSLEDKNQELFEWFARYAVEFYPKELTQYRDLMKSVDLRKPHHWYPVARSLKRNFIYHAGPTNSGKTYNALQRMMEAGSGVYCGPLRLLAMEVFDTCNALGTFCNLVTGQEKKMIPGAEHTSCTIEMLNTSNRVDVAVVDEVQLIGDNQRGWAWTKALLALPANEIHLCGDGSAIELVQRIASEMGEGFQVKEYQRLTPVEVERCSSSNSGYANVQEGDCLVAFSRKAIYDVKSKVEQATGLRTCLIYGALPPETRRQQAKLFNDSDNEFNVLVASDAVGMGLNLNIRRIIFTTLTKYINNEKCVISTSEIKQIAGRAGRRNSKFPYGFATCLNPKDMPILHEALKTPLSELHTPRAGLFPEFEHFEAYATKTLISDISKLIELFAAESRLDGVYFFCKQDSMMVIAKLLADIKNLSLQERFTFCSAPVNTRDPRQTACLLHFAKRFAEKRPVNLEVFLPEKCPDTPDELQQLEGLHQMVSLWLWLSLRLEAAAFPSRDNVVSLSEDLIGIMDTSLERMCVPSDTQRSTSKLTLQDLAQMRQPYLRNMCKEARQHVEEVYAAKDEEHRHRLLSKMAQFRDQSSLVRQQNQVQHKRAFAAC